MKFFLILISVLFLGGCATGNRNSVVKSSSAPPEIFLSIDGDGNFVPKSNVADKRNRALLAKAYDALKDGKQQEAIDKYLNPVIADFEKIYPGKSTIVYSARDQMEALLYLVIASASHDKTNQTTAPRKLVIIVASFWSEAFFLKGNINITLGRLGEGKKWLNKAIALSPHNSMYMSELGYIYQVEKKYKQALKIFEKAEASTTYSPKNSKNRETGRALRGAGYSLTELGRLDEAEKKYHEALKINPADRISKGELNYIRGLRANTS